MLDYIVDFYCHEIQLAIEIDGNSHDFKGEYDARRQKRLEAYGVTFLRFTNREVKNNIHSVELVIKETAENLQTLFGHPSSSLRGEN